MVLPLFADFNEKQLFLYSNIKIMKRIICIISLITCVLCASAQVFVESEIDSIEILIGEQTDVTLSVTAKKGAEVKMPEFQPSQYLTPGVEVLGHSAADTSHLDNGLVKITKRYTLTSFDEKLYSSLTG